MHKERDYIRVGGNAWGFGGLGWYVGMCCGELRLIHHTAGELFNAWQAPWSLVRELTKFQFLKRWKPPVISCANSSHEYEQVSSKTWFSLSQHPCFALVLLRGQMRGYLTHSENNFNFCEGQKLYFQARILFSVLNCCKGKHNHQWADFPNRCILNKGVDVIKWR